MTIDITTILTTVIGALVVGAIVVVARHISNSRKHLDPEEKIFDRIVFTDVCEPNMKRLENCIESEAKLCKQRYESLSKQVDAGFEEVKELIRNGKG